MSRLLLLVSLLLAALGPAAPARATALEDELRAARLALVRLGRFLAGGPGKVAVEELADLVDEYEAWKTAAGRKGAWGVVRFDT
jgi:hypothetical protein